MKTKLLLLFIALLIGFGLQSKATNTTIVEDSNLENLEIEWEIYPNPASSVLYIKLKSSHSEELKFEVMNFIGNSIDIQPTKYEHDSYRLDVSNLSNGYYYIIIKDSESGKKTMKKFLKR